MVTISFELNDELDARFRAAVYKKFALKKGSIRDALAEAIFDWCRKVEAESK